MYEKQSKKWLLTINNPKEKGLSHDVIKNILTELNLYYFCIADEVGDEKRIYHTHVFFLCSSYISFNKIKNLFPTAHIDIARGSPRENKDYVFKIGKWRYSSKSETNLRDTQYEWGKIPTEHVCRPDLEELYNLVYDGILVPQESKESFLLRLNDNVSASIILYRKKPIFIPYYNDL